MAKKATLGFNDLKKGDRVCLTVAGGHELEATVRCRMNPTAKHPNGGFRLPGDQYCTLSSNSNGHPPKWQFHNAFCSMKVIKIQKLN